MYMYMYFDGSMKNNYKVIDLCLLYSPFSAPVDCTAFPYKVYIFLKMFYF
jgi:hypothetical protein